MNSNQRILKTNVEILFPELSYEISGVCFSVQNKLGRFCREKQYADEFERLLIEKGLSYKREFPVKVNGQNSGNIVDFIIEEKIIVELKAKRFLTKDDYYQTKRYLASLNLNLGLIVNFRDSYIKPKRILRRHS